MASKPTTNWSKDSGGSKASESKRLFDDTPQKDKQNEPKKQKNSWDIPSDDDSDPFRASGPQKSRPKASGFNVPPVGPAPQQNPKFKMPKPLSDDDTEDSPTRASSTTVPDQGSLTLPGSPKRPVRSALSCTPIRISPGKSQVGSKMPSRSVESSTSIPHSSSESGNMMPPTPPRRVLPVTSQAMFGASFAAPTGMSSRLPVSVPRRSQVSSSTFNPPSMGSGQQIGTSDLPSGSRKVTLGSGTGSDDGGDGSRPRSATSNLANQISHLHIAGRSRSATPDDESDPTTPPKRARSPKACLIPAEGQISEPSDASDEGRSQVLTSLASVRRSRAIPRVILDSDDEDELDDSDENGKAEMSSKPVDEEDKSTEDEEAQTNLDPQDEEENLVRSGADPKSSDAAGAEDEIDEEDEDEDPRKAYSKLMSRVAEEVYDESQREMDQDDLDGETQVPQTQATLPNGSSTYEDYSSKLIGAYNEGLDSLVRVALYLRGMPCDIWVQRRIASGPVKYENLMFSFWLMMAGWDPLILEHLVHGDLPAAALTDAELEKKLRKLKNIPAINECCPCIYMQYLVDASGKSPTPEILGKILDIVEMYAKADAKDIGFVGRIDSAMVSPNWGWNSAKAGRKRYLESPEQTKTCLNWAKAARERMEGLPKNEPLARPWAECGYATYPMERLDQHAKHNSSNYLMNLTDAICRLNFPSYRIRQYVVHHIVHYTHAMYDEILASRISLAYTTQGGGWCHFRAGVSHREAETKAKPEHFSRKQMALMTDRKFRTRLTDEIQKMEKNADFLEEFANKGVELREEIEEAFALAEIVDEQLIKVNEAAEKLVKEIYEDLDPILAFMDFMDGLSDDGGS